MQNMEYLISEPIRITNVLATILDQIIANSPNVVKDISITPPNSTNDHCTVSECLNFKIKRNLHISTLCGITKKLSFLILDRLFLIQILMNVLHQNDVDETCTKWTDTFCNTAKAHMPNKIVTTGQMIHLSTQMN